MSSFSETMKKGWHPKGKDGKSKESWRGDFKGIDQVAGWMGKSRSKTDSNEPEHVARPLSSLKDPSSFGPPPKRTNSAGLNSSAPSLGSATPPSHLRHETRQPEPEPEEPKPPPQPYRRDTTGLSTEHLPLPPARRDGADGRPPAPAGAPAPSRAPKPKPSLPPRLPPRQTENPSEYTPPPPPTYHEATQEPPAHRGILNQTSIDRLGAAGVSIPGFGIGSSPSPPLPSRASATSTTQPPAKSNNSQLNELQSRFSRLETSSPKEESSSQGTTWAEKQAALKTASSFRNDPSSVSLSDARNAASTANNFRERHGALVASGLKSVNALDTKYGVPGRASGAYGARNPQGEPEQDYSSGISMEDNTSRAVKKAPPPPPKKKPGLAGNIENAGGPPPIPHASKPKPPK